LGKAEIRDLDRVSTRRPVPKAAPLALVTDAWRPYMENVRDTC
jgi:hypothetical protein